MGSKGVTSSQGDFDFTHMHCYHPVHATEVLFDEGQRSFSVKKQIIG